MPNPFARMAEYASLCYIAHVSDAAAVKDPTSITLTPPPTITKKVNFKAPKKTQLDVQVFYENGARVVYLRGKRRIGPLLSHMHSSDIMKILPRL